MIAGIGIDMVHIPRIQAMLDKHGDKIAERILHERELAEFKLQLKPANYLAKRFAAKEAVAKALGNGFRDGLSLRHIFIINDELGKPYVEFEHVASKVTAEKHIAQCLISLSDEHEYAIAYATAIKSTL